jgi:hypothetical protein
MTRLTLLSIALILLLIAFPLVSIGTVQNMEAVWWLGLLALVAGGVIPPVTRFTHEVADDEEEEEKGEGSDTE